MDIQRMGDLGVCMLGASIETHEQPFAGRSHSDDLGHTGLATGVLPAMFLVFPGRFSPVPFSICRSSRAVDD